MFIKNPNQKVSYSFRIKEELLESLKAYAKATNQTLPETLNNLLEESVEGVNTGNTYLNNYDGILINIPLMYHYTHFDTDFVENSFTEFIKGTSNYLDFEVDGLTYEVKQIPNNLDTWSSKGMLNNVLGGKGYFSKNYPTIVHEGVSLLIVPELILNPELYITDESILNCLKFIYFQIDKENNIQVRQISYKDCFRRLKEAGNEEVLYKFKSIDSTLYKFSLSYMAELQKDPEPEIDNYRVNLYGYLVNFAKKYNDNNITSLEDINTFELPPAPDEDNTKANQKGLVLYTPEGITELLEENQSLKDRITDLENKFDKINDLIEKSQDPNYRKQCWEDIEKQQ